MKRLNNIGLFALGAVLICSLAYQNTFNKGDFSTKSITLKKGQTVTHVVDLRKEGFIKSIFQPNVYSTYIRIKVDGMPKLSCKGESENMQLYLSQGSKKGYWPELKEDMILETNGKRMAKTRNASMFAGSTVLAVNVELKLKDKSDGKGKLILSENGQEYGIIELKVIKS